MRWPWKMRDTGGAEPESATAADVKAAYRLLLGREADARGLRDHLEWAAHHKVPPSALADRIMRSEE